MKQVAALASELLQCLVHKQFEKLVPHYGPIVKQVITDDLLAKAWSGVIAKSGGFQFVQDVKHVGPAVHLLCKCEKNDMKVSFSFDDNNLITALTFVLTNYELPQYAELPLFTEEEIEFGDGKWKLPGKITVPSVPGKYPCVVLVHGSGFLDEDETIGPNKPFKDIAYGLASRGVAVLRYPKRNFQYGKSLTTDEINNFTLVEECIEDPIAAVSRAATHPKIDKEKIFVLGHSLGGFACPLIAQRAGSSVRGLILMAGNARHLGDMILDQMNYLASVTGQVDRKRLDAIETAVQKAHDPALSEHTRKDQLLNIPPKYWLFLQKYDPIQVARSISQSILVLHAARDYQVTREDFFMWKSIKDENRMTFVEYQGLNHLMIGCDPSIRDKLATPEEYNTPGNVDVRVITDIEKWVKSF